MKAMTWNAFASTYCERQEQTPEGLRTVLQAQLTRYKCDGWMLLECQMMDSSLLGGLTILPYGPKNTWRTLPCPDQPISPRGLASDMSICIGYLLATEFLT